MTNKILISCLIGWCAYQQVNLYNQEIIQKEIVKDLIVIQAELDMYTKTDLVK